MAETGKVVIILFILACAVLLAGRLTNSTALLWISIILFVCWVLGWVIESIFDVVLWR